MTLIGLRERKRLAAMHRAQEAALDLFDEHGYEAVTIEQVAAAADVSPSSIYRYFGTKEQLVLWDEVDPVAFQALAEGLAGDEPPLVAARRAMRQVVEEVFGRAGEEELHLKRMRYMLGEPAIRRMLWAETERTAEALAASIAARLDRDMDELAIQVFAHAMTGAFIAAFHHWHANDYRQPLTDLLDEVFDILDNGFDLR